MPAVLIECGFLSNPDECAKLSSDNYQRQLSRVIADAIASHLKRASLDS